MSENKPSALHTPSNEEDDGIVEVDDASQTSNAASIGEISLAKDETRVVHAFRIVLMVLLIATAVAVSLTAFFLTKQGEQDDFEDAFEGHSTKIIETFESEAIQKRTAIVHLSRDLTSHAKFANESWPFVTMPDFEMKARVILELADVVGLMVLPLVTKENVEKYSEYTVANQEWFWEGMAIQEMVHGVNATNSGVEHFDAFGLVIDGDITKFNEGGPNEDVLSITDADDGPFFPCWQFSPQIPVPVVGSDFGTLPDAKAELNAFLENDERRNMVGPAFEFDAGTGGAVFLDLLLERWQDGGRHYNGGPLSFYYIPVYEDFTRNSPMVAIVMGFIYWQTYFEQLLPYTARGINVVVENTCEQNLTFYISGGNATFLGYQDLHDSKYDYLEASTDFGAFLQRDPDGIGGCSYKLRVYPTQELEDDHVTSTPLIICLSMLGVFVFTTVVFILYDRFVEKRQRLVLKTAKQSSDVVSNLFPDTVRQRLYEKDNKNTETEKGGQFLVGSQKAAKFLGRSDGSTSMDPLKSAPIADEYLNCSVFFADLAGFTKWSSTRTPSEVFMLLETLYGAFDKIAKKLDIFKVETIGDCYVAVTGLPVPQDNHALIMCKFAASCIFKMNQIVNRENILLSLGDDTANLEMRIGIHSGPVTAGVLRGEKARFQLFGDTVNTAARMESNGQKGRIQVSQDTADLLIAAGKTSWVTAREDLVEAKGKGKMQCYWVDLSSEPSIKSSTMSSSVVSSNKRGPGATNARENGIVGTVAKGFDAEAWV